VGILLAAIARRRWLTMGGFVLVFVSLFFIGSALGSVLVGLGAGLLIAQVPIAIWARRAGAKGASTGKANLGETQRG
jgi:hypothetical protein